MNEFDVIIIGSGAAGLYCALNLNPQLKVTVITKAKLRESNSYLAQGGITTVLGQNDKASFIEDTLRAGKYENDLQAVNLLAERSAHITNDLMEMKMPFAFEKGRLCYTREGAHSKNRIAYAEDETGKHLIETLLQEIFKRKNITLQEETSLADIIEDPASRSCIGAVVEKNCQAVHLACGKTVIACGGIGGLFKNSTNQKTVTGDAIAIARKHGIVLKNLNYIQFHPTALYEESSGGIRFLISESVRGEGGYLFNLHRKRFVNELLPRDEVTSAIVEEQKKYNRVPSVYLDISHRDSDFIKTRFPAIYQKCLKAGYDITKEWVPITPAQHYHMGGIQTDLRGRTSMANLYAIGEASCTGVHGANRLASNSLLEALVYAKQAAMDINENIVPHCAACTKNTVTYPELLDANYRRKLVNSILINENGGIENELCNCR